MGGLNLRGERALAVPRNNLPLKPTLEARQHSVTDEAPLPRGSAKGYGGWSPCKS